MNNDHSHRQSALTSSTGQGPTAERFGLERPTTETTVENDRADAFSMGERWRWCIGRPTADDVERAGELIMGLVDAGGFTSHAPMTEEEVVYLVKGLQAAGFDPMSHVHVLPEFEAIQVALCELSRSQASGPGSRLAALRDAGHDVSNVLAFPEFG